MLWEFPFFFSFDIPSFFPVLAAFILSTQYFLFPFAKDILKKDRFPACFAVSLIHLCLLGVLIFMHCICFLCTDFSYFFFFAVLL